MLWRLARHPSPYRIVHAVAYACMCSFMLGYHVHEKAALMVRALHKPTSAYISSLCLGISTHPIHPFSLGDDGFSN